MAGNTGKKADELCRHSHLYLECSPHAAVSGFKRLPGKKRIAAATRKGRTAGQWNLLTGKTHFEDAMTFPGPLVLPDDDLAEDPEYPPQDFEEWDEEEERNPVTPERKTIYVISSPQIKPEMSQVKSWSTHIPSRPGKISSTVQAPTIASVVEYLAAFFHGMKVKASTQKYYWQAWDGEDSSKLKSKTSKSFYDGTPLKNPDDERRIGLKTPSRELFGIRCRASPDNVSSMQVNLDDVLDAIIVNIPKDAHSVIMLLDQDMYEGDEDIFTGGRAYGGSRIGAVSRFRDHPDCTPDDDGHAWPASHCATYIDELCSTASEKVSKGKKKLQPTKRQSSPLHIAIEAATAAHIPPMSASPHTLSTQWLGRTVQTISHELGHCLGLDHCVYFACTMQGCASLAEAVRQPPYLCPVCLEKLEATVRGAVLKKSGEDDGGARLEGGKYVEDRYKALRLVCRKYGAVAGSSMFAGYAAWLDGVIDGSG